MSQTPRFYPVSLPTLGGNELEYVTDAVRSGWISSLGTYVTRFEEEFAAFCEVEHAISVSNGTVAIHLALAVLDVGPGDEVIVPDLSFIATANSVLMCGAKPVFCDVDPVTLCMDPVSAEAAITPATKAIMPVHLYGHPADLVALKSVCDRHNLLMIEDAAEAHGASAYGRKVGGFGTCATFSFYANKNLTTGEGGMITTNDGALAARLRKRRDHAMSPQKRYWHTEMGFNYRITNMQAAVGCAQLEQAEELLGARRRVFDVYQKNLGAVDGLLLNRTAQWADNSYWMVCAEIPGMEDATRETLMARLREKGVDTRPYFYPMSHMPYLERADNPVATTVSQAGLNLPTHAQLNDDDITHISAVFMETVREMELV